MDQFDKIIKDKLNDKSYDYQPKAWRSFKHSSGMPMLSSGAKLALSAAAVVAVVGTVLYFSLIPNTDPQESIVAVTEEQKAENLQIDTIDWAENRVSEEITEEAVANTSHTPATAPVQSKPQLQQTSVNNSPTENNEENKPHQPRHITKTIHYRPTEILVDTISSIDFPDYEVKPADMLP